MDVTANASLQANASSLAASNSTLDDVTVILTAFILGILILTTVIGNVFVIVAIYIERNLQSVANYLIISLAVADLLVALLVMPLGAVYEARNPRRIGFLIAAVWIVALGVSLAPQLGWKDPGYLDRIAEGRCLISQDPAYQIFATCATFYLPLLVILFLYWRIFQAARRRIRKRPGTTIQPPRERRGILRLVRKSPREESTAFTITRSTPDHSSVSPEKSSSHNGANAPAATTAPTAETASATTPAVAHTTVMTTTTLTSSSSATTTMTTTTITASTRKTRETIEAKRERKAAKTLAIITGAFVACWLPFFLVALLRAVCGPCQPPDLVDSVFLWLGYFNSTLNPVIYTVFSPEFRQAFKRILGIAPPRQAR
ncbi:5-hydroxytryptamine receptor isoform X2 [Phymastichus coffea]|uniref:5-hydroxytryptamine receptor isoform X2 n=1 Tax=Phymastichus coffea TaxID=108790 RepID=UPI00273C20CC|nr:5-hydroxytryptamine receptor isoform X2 [Phymastichus coffea]